MSLAVLPRIRLTAMELLPGCRKSTVWLVPMSKLCQLSESVWLFCWTVVTLPDCAIEPEPPTIWPPVGVLPAQARLLMPMDSDSRESISGARAMEPLRLAPVPLLFANSEAGTQARSVRFQQRR